MTRRELLAQRLKQARGAMTQTALSRISGISQPTISDIENERHTPTALVAGDLAKALQLSVDYLVGLTNIARPLGAADTNTPYHADTPVLAIEQFASAGPGADALDEHAAPEVERGLHILPDLLACEVTGALRLGACGLASIVLGRQLPTGASGPVTSVAFGDVVENRLNVEELSLGAKRPVTSHWQLVILPVASYRQLVILAHARCCRENLVGSEFVITAN